LVFIREHYEKQSNDSSIKLLSDLGKPRMEGKYTGDVAIVKHPIASFCIFRLVQRLG